VASEVRERNRSHTSKGPGVMPYTKTSAPTGTKLWNKCPIKRPDDPKWRQSRG
jgi:hypothetical protein